MQGYKHCYAVIAMQMTDNVYFMNAECVDIEGENVNFDEHYSTVEKAAEMMGWRGFAFDANHLCWAVTYLDDNEICDDIERFCRSLSDYAHDATNVSGLVEVNIDVIPMKGNVTFAF